jgi:quercetin dioxygenase-like cupin family protein
MNIEPTVPTTKNPPEQFAGDVWLDPIALPHDGDQRMVVATVRFAPGARTAWHFHARGQYLRVTQGVGRFGTRDGNIIEVHPGQTIYTPPGQEHWHAAGENTFMEHIAMLEGADDPADTTVWLEHITDDHYRGTTTGADA